MKWYRRAPHRALILLLQRVAIASNTQWTWASSARCIGPLRRNSEDIRQRTPVSRAIGNWLGPRPGPSWRQPQSENCETNKSGHREFALYSAFVFNCSLRPHILHSPRKEKWSEVCDLLPRWLMNVSTFKFILDQHVCSAARVQQVHTLHIVFIRLATRHRTHLFLCPATSKYQTVENLLWHRALDIFHAHIATTELVCSFARSIGCPLFVCSPHAERYRQLPAIFSLSFDVWRQKNTKKNFCVSCSLFSAVWLSPIFRQPVRVRKHSFATKDNKN